jgi:pimeloyl-ACP methyl ester carboxylesterase
MPPRIESLLSARLILVPQLVGNFLYFISNLSGRLSLYRMKPGGSVPQPLLPPDIALQNPHLIDGYSYYVFPKLDKIIVMIDRDGDENYQPLSIPLDGGFPELAFGDKFLEYRVHLVKCDLENNLIYLAAESRHSQTYESYQCDLRDGSVHKLAESTWGAWPDGASQDHNQVIVVDGYTIGDHVLYLWTRGEGERRLLFGTPMEARAEGQEILLNSIQDSYFTPGGGLLFKTALFSDSYGLGYFCLDEAKDGDAPVRPVAITRIVHSGEGEFDHLEHLVDDRYALYFNIDGCSWAYEGSFNEEALTMELRSVVCGQGELSNGVLEAAYYDKSGDNFALSFSTATSPTQIYTVEGRSRMNVIRHTDERILGTPKEWLSAGEDASFISYDETRISARLYLPSPALGVEGRRPLVYYVHGGPQGQERPDFAWFSMPLIQFLTLSGFAVFVPNVRGSTGYGLNFTKQVDRDWGGRDRLDHVFAMREFLPQDERLDLSRAGVVGRSYGGYMTLTLAGRHPELWQAAVDMFGPYDLITFSERIPETWKPYMKIAIGDPVEDRDLLVERSPRTYLDDLACPLLVIQGNNDPRVVERESRDLVEDLRSKGKTIEYLVFENEGHDVLKFENRVTCYNRITKFFADYLKP